jgi:hypothetical protein
VYLPVGVVLVQAVVATGPDTDRREAERGPLRASSPQAAARTSVLKASARAAPLGVPDMKATHRGIVR